MLALALITCLAMAIGSAAIARSKNRSAASYFLLGLFIPLVGLLIAIGMAPLRPEDREPAASASTTMGWLVLGALGVWAMIALTAK